MAMQVKNIRPGIGLGDVLFGQSVEDVEGLLGPAPESSFERDDDDSTRTLAYPAEGMYLFFYEEDDPREEDDFRLWSIEVCVAAGAYCLFGMPLLAVDKEAIMGLLSLHLSPTEMEGVKEDFSDIIEELALRVPALRATFYFGQDGILEDLHWGPFFGPDDEVIWPSEGS